MPDAMLLSPGPPPLSLLAADCAIDLIDFMAATVRGVDLLDVTPAVREAFGRERVEDSAQGTTSSEVDARGPWVLEPAAVGAHDQLR